MCVSDNVEAGKSDGLVGGLFRRVLVGLGSALLRLRNKAVMVGRRLLATLVYVSYSILVIRSVGGELAVW